MNPSPQYDEKVLLQRVADGDEKAFSELFHQYSDLLGNVILRFGGSAEIAEDLVQEIFLKIWMGRETLVTVNNFKTFLYVIARNQTLNAVEKAINRRNLLKKMRAVSEQEENDMAEKEQQEIHFSLLDEAIAQLPPQQQKVFLLNRREGLKYREIAREMSISQETVKKYIQIAVASITTYMKDRVPLLLMLLLR